MSAKRSPAISLRVASQSAPSRSRSTSWAARRARFLRHDERDRQDVSQNPAAERQRGTRERRQRKPPLPATCCKGGSSSPPKAERNTCWGEEDKKHCHHVSCRKPPRTPENCVSSRPKPRRCCVSRCVTAVCAVSSSAVRELCEYWNGMAADSVSGAKAAARRVCGRSCPCGSRLTGWKPIPPVNYGTSSSWSVSTSA
jgi:hypothetical protein